MKYENIEEAIFIDRPNRFIANVNLLGQSVVCHVKNTGRCRELLIPGTRVILQRVDNPARRTKYDLIAVYKGGELINIDSAAPNKVFHEYLQEGKMGYIPRLIRPECTFSDSRLDFYFEHSDIKSFAEIKGVTLEEKGIVRFPDAPTVRGTKHLRTLISALEQGYEAYCVFIVQLNNAKYFEPNRETDMDFSKALTLARERGVKLLALKCDVSPDEIRASDEIEIRL